MSEARSWGQNAYVEAIHMNDQIFEDKSCRCKPPIFLNHINYFHFQPLPAPDNKSATDILATVGAQAYTTNQHEGLAL